MLNDGNENRSAKSSKGGAKSVDDVISEARALRRRDRGKAQVDAQKSLTPILTRRRNTI